MKNNSAIHPDMTVEELIETWPKSVGILMEEGIVCVQCGEPVWGTLRDTITGKGKDVEAVITRLNHLFS